MKKFKFLTIIILCFVILVGCGEDYEDTTPTDYTQYEDEEENESVDKSEYIGKKLSEFAMSREEYKNLYIRSGLDYVGYDEHIYSTLVTDILYRNYQDVYDKKLIEFSMYKDNETAPYYAADITVAGYRLGYDYMFAPALLYIKNLPGAITDVDEIVRKWDDLSVEGNPVIQTYRCDGITYTRIKYTNEDVVKLGRDIEISVTVDLNHIIGSDDSASNTSADYK